MAAAVRRLWVNGDQEIDVAAAEPAVARIGVPST